MSEPRRRRPPVGRRTITWPRPESGLERRFITVGGHRVSYVTGGQGAPILLIHGVGAGNVAWRFTLPALMEHYTVYAVDLLGCGESDKPSVAYTLEMFAASLVEFLDALALPRVHLIGHSFGGGVAMTLRLLAPDRIDKIVLADSGGMGRDMHWLLRISTLPGAQGVLGALASPYLRVPQASRALERRRLRRLRGTLDESAPTVLDRLRDPQTRRAFISMLRQAAGVRGQRVSALEHLARMDSPTLILWGADDRAIPVTHGIVAAALMPRAYLEIIPRCYHRPQIEAPQVFNDLVLSFLAATTWPPVSERPPHVIRRPAHWRRIAPAALLFSVPVAGVGLALRARRARRLP